VEDDEGVPARHVWLLNLAQGIGRRDEGSQCVTVISF
jgi:hypothetical protein